MKNYPFLIVAFLCWLCMFFVASCSKSQFGTPSLPQKASSVDPFKKLPLGNAPQVHVGIGTVSAKINGELWTADEVQAFVGSPPTNPNVQMFSAYAMKFPHGKDATPPNFQHLSFGINGVLDGLGTYPISVYVVAVYAVVGNGQQKGYMSQFVRTDPGYISVVEVDDQYIKGVFDFKVSNGTETVEVTDGIFHLNYTDDVEALGELFQTPSQ